MVLHPFYTLALVLGPYFPFEGYMGYYFAKFSFFHKFQSTCLSSVTFWNAVPTFWLSDADAIKTVHASRNAFPKEVEAYETINIYGPNMVGTEGIEWKRHRHVANSAFNEANNAFVWRETIRVVDEWFEEIDNAKQNAPGETSVDLLKDLTQVTLLVIASAGFGHRVSFKEDLNTDPPPGQKLAFRPAVTATLHHVLIKAIIPKALWNLSDRMYLPLISPLVTSCRESFAALGFHMHEVIASARDLIANDKGATMDSALLRNLVQANMVNDASDTSKHLTDDDLLSNTFASGEYTLAVFNETLRLFPPVARLGKKVQVDTTLTARRFDTDAEGKISNVEKYDVELKTGSFVVIDIRALHFNRASAVHLSLSLLTKFYTY
ncbi:hypothetical protein H0H87_004358 [Tephrocybe sp. NHM501043]|nr:hypothetical protein H0H87_004358 [Tephrocybe sp. NHM501043]